MMAEVAAYFPGAVTADTPWPLFLALHRRTPMFEARALARAHLGTAGGIGTAFGGEADAGRDLLRSGYPVVDAVPQMIENLASSKRGDADG